MSEMELLQLKMRHRDILDENESLSKVVEILHHALADYEQGMEAIGGCGDGNCVIVRPQGMHTNGGCRCSEDRHKARRAMAYASYLACRLRSALAEQEKAMTDWTAIPEEVRKELVERLTRPIIGIDNRTPLEVFDIMCDRIRAILEGRRP